MRTRVGWVWLAGCLAFGAQARAQTDEADAHYEGHRIEEARLAYRAALQSGRLSPSETARAHRRLGVVAATFGDLETARASFERALAIEPNVPAPRALAPDQRSVYDAIAAEVEPVQVVVRSEAGAGRALVSAEVTGGDALDVTGWVLHEGSRRETLELTPTDFGTALELAVEVVAVDAAGNVVAVGRFPVARPVSVAAPTPVSSTPSEAPAPRELTTDGGGRGWKIALVIAAVLVAAGAAVGIAYATRTESVQYVLE